MKVLFIDTNHSVLHQMLLKAGIECEFAYNLVGEELLQRIYLAEGIVIRSRIKLTKLILERCEKLKFIARAGAGMENIDVSYAESKGIKCLHAPEGNANAVGEHAIGMLLSLMNNINRADVEVRKGLWNREANRGEEIEGKTIGIIGYGNMGKSLAKKLKGFDVSILAYDKYLTSYSDENVRESSLNELFEQCDVLSLHIPYTAETNYFANEDFFNSFKKPIYFINTARGKCCDTSALVKAIQSNKVKGACLDVLEYETISFEKVDFSLIPEPLQFLLKSDKVILTPHIAGWTNESNYKIDHVLAKKIIALA